MNQKGLPRRKQKQSKPQSLSANALSVVLQYLSFEEGLICRQLSKAAKERAWANSQTTFELNHRSLVARVESLSFAYGCGRRRADNQFQPYWVAPKLISEMTSVTKVKINGLNLAKYLTKDDQSSSMLECLEQLTSEANGWKVKEIELKNVSVSTIFEAETLCKKFFNKLTAVESLKIIKCQSMFLEKFFMLTKTLHSNLTH